MSSAISLPEGHRILLQRVKQELARVEDKLLGVIIESVLEQLALVDRLQEEIDHIDKRLATLCRQNQQMLVLQTVPGIGLIPRRLLRWYRAPPISTLLTQDVSLQRG